MNIRELVKAQALAITELDPLKGNSLILLTATGIISGTPVFSDDDLTKETDIPRTLLRACFGKLDEPQSKKHNLCGNDHFFLLRNVSIRQGSNPTNCPYLFVSYNAVQACSLGKFG